MADLTESKSKGSVLFVVGVCLVAAMGGLLFGYDTSSIVVFHFSFTV